MTSTGFGTASAYSFYAQFEHFANVVCEGETPAVTPQDALQDLLLMEALIGA